jgi:hypothetical protein
MTTLERIRIAHAARRARFQRELLRRYPETTVPYIVVEVDGVKTLCRNRFGEAIMRSYADMRARHEAQYESELTRFDNPGN